MERNTELVAHRAQASAVLDWVARALLIIGGLNWGLVGLFHLDAVAALFGTMTTAARVVYLLVGLAALYGIVRVASRPNRL